MELGEHRIGDGLRRVPGRKEVDEEEERAFLLPVGDKAGRLRELISSAGDRMGPFRPSLTLMDGDGGKRR